MWKGSSKSSGTAGDTGEVGVAFMYLKTWFFAGSILGCVWGQGDTHRTALPMSSPSRFWEPPASELDKLRGPQIHKINNTFFNITLSKILI